MHVIGSTVKGGIGEQDTSTLGRVVFNLVGGTLSQDIRGYVPTPKSLQGLNISIPLLCKETDVTPW